MQPSVENLCNQLAKHRLLETDIIKNLRNRWRGEAGAAADRVPEFRKWIVRNSSLTEFQLDMLDRGFADFLHFGEYNLIERLAGGRMAGIYKALHPLGQVVAIKVLPPAKAKHPQLLARFQREARLALQLDHDNVVRTFQAGQTKDGVHHLVMEFVEGETLEETLKRRGKLSFKEVVHILTQALLGLEHLHELGMVHRDIKPANFMLAPEPGAEPEKSALGCTVKLLDIGLGKALFDEGAPGEEGGELTTEGTLLGTLDYMAPEQARDASGADIRADLYGLGCVAYEMLAGEPPFADSNFMNQVRRHAEEKPKPLAERVPGVPAGLEKVVMKLLAKDPALRYATPGQALRDVRAIESTALPPPPPAAPRPLPSYLTWLKAQAPSTNGDSAAPPAPAGGKAAASPPRPTALMTAAPPPAPVTVQGRPPQVQAPQVQAPQVQAPQAQAPQVQAPQAAGPSAPVPAILVSQAPTQLVQAGTPPPRDLIVQTPKAPDRSFRNFLATTRDWAAFGVGGAVVLLMVLVYALIRLASE